MDRMRAQIEQLAIPSADGGALTLSVGVAELDPAKDSSGHTWIARADTALYMAKSRGRNRVVSTLPPRI
jgi:diguanylate cyclase (GGDEF)-like protein